MRRRETWGPPFFTVPGSLAEPRAGCSLSDEVSAGGEQSNCEGPFCSCALCSERERRGEKIDGPTQDG